MNVNAKNEETFLYVSMEKRILQFLLFMSNEILEEMLFLHCELRTSIDSEVGTRVMLRHIKSKYVINNYIHLTREIVFGR